MGFSNTTTRKLRAKLNGDNIRTREWNGKTLSYIEGWHALAEANRIFGFDGWNRETVDLLCIEEGKSQQSPHCAYIAKVRISVQAGEDTIIREGTGAGHSVASSLAEAHALAAKEAETDATKRALVTFGNPFGLALYDREQKNVRHPKPKASGRILWEAKDYAGNVIGKYADPHTCASALFTKINEADNIEGLQRFWSHNESLIAELHANLHPGADANRDNVKIKNVRPINGRANGDSTPKRNVNRAAEENTPDLLSTYQRRFTELKDALLSDGVPKLVAKSLPNRVGQEKLDSQQTAEPAPGKPAAIPPNADKSASGRIDKSVLAISSPKRIRAPEHVKWVATLPCLVCQRRPTDAHHLKRVQPNAMGRKPGDQWVVPLCRIHHRTLHDAGDENGWWKAQGINAVEIAQNLWAEKLG